MKIFACDQTFQIKAFYARRSLDGLVSQLWRDFKMAANRARFMEKLPLFVRGLYDTTTRKTGDLQILSLSEYVVIDVFYELSCRLAQELWSFAAYGA